MPSASPACNAESVVWLLETSVLSELRDWAVEFVSDDSVAAVAVERLLMSAQN
ncbi:hypothetical protein [Burkholderia glumae]